MPDRQVHYFGSNEERFWPRVTDGPTPQHRPELGPCAIWTGGQDGNGYGAFRLDEGKVTRAHRYAWIRAQGDIPRGKTICHRCDNRLCVRVDHLFLGTNTENNADMLSKGRAWHQQPREPVPECQRGHPFDETNTYWYGGKRHCQLCRKAARDRWRLRMQATLSGD